MHEFESYFNGECYGKKILNEKTLLEQRKFISHMYTYNSNQFLGIQKWYKRGQSRD